MTMAIVNERSNVKRMKVLKKPKLDCTIDRNQFLSHLFEYVSNDPHTSHVKQCNDCYFLFFTGNIKFLMQKQQEYDSNGFIAIIDFRKISWP